MIYQFAQKSFGIAVFILLLSGCDSGSTTNPPATFQAEERFIGNLSYPASVGKLVVGNPHGFTNVSGLGTMARIDYVIDRRVQASSFDLATQELDSIFLTHTLAPDSLVCLVSTPFRTDIDYEGNLAMEIFGETDLVVREPNQGLRASWITGTLTSNCGDFSTEIDQHQGSVRATSRKGPITATLSLGIGGFCYCFSDSGDITVRIPMGTSADISLKTESGSLSLSNLSLVPEVETTREIRGRIGSGGATITLESRGGKVTLEGF
ncbi:MAG TPA: DUF4097 family beta strand repeat-containing protein [Calditrichia bacterium]|nr:hypothetical protein [Calditrichota bacterium]HQV34629.1 DUF4097 family beta strand repeat-containing protein [Calditrichia bacterium]